MGMPVILTYPLTDGKQKLPPKGNLSTRSRPWLRVARQITLVCRPVSESAECQSLPGDEFVAQF
jgi:hypothetical protein